jgi:hypothetical protein
MQKTPVKYGFLAFMARTTRRRRDALAGAHKRSRRPPNRVRFDENLCTKFFWMTSLNRTVDDPAAIGIARIGRLAIRMRVASHDHEDHQCARNRRPTNARSNDSTDDRAVHTTSTSHQGGGPRTGCAVPARDDRTARCDDDRCDEGSRRRGAGCPDQPRVSYGRTALPHSRRIRARAWP